MKKQYSVLTHESNFTPPDLGLEQGEKYSTSQEKSL